MTATVFDVDEAGFQAGVVERSHEVPVAVDFWAAWCGPCRTLGPLLEELVWDRHGQVVLAKVDVDANPRLSQRFGVRGIPAVMGFRNGAVVEQFTGAVPRGQVESFLDALVPSEADRLVARAREQAPERAVATYEEALRLQPDHRDAAIGLAELVVEDEPERALELVARHRPDPAAEAVAVRADIVSTAGGDEAALRAQVAASPEDGEAHLLLGRSLAARHEYADAIDHLLAAVRAGGDVRETARAQLVGLFTVLGHDHELVAAARRELAKALF